MKINVRLFIGSRIHQEDKSGTSLVFHNCFLVNFIQTVSTNALPGIGNELDIEIPRSDRGPFGMPKVEEIKQTLENGVLHHHVTYKLETNRDYESTFGKVPDMERESTEVIKNLLDFDDLERAFLRDRIIPDLIKKGFRVEWTDRPLIPASNP